MSDKQSNDNSQEIKIDRESNDATFETKEQIKKILEKQLNQSGANDESAPNPSNKKPPKDK